MRLLRSARGLVILVSTPIFLSALLLGATHYFQPMKFKKMKRFAFKWVKVFLPEKKLRDYKVNAYKPAALHSDIFRRTQLSADLHKTHIRLMEKEFHTDSPRRIPKGKTISQLVRNVDILPTILDLVGIQYNNKSYRGLSLLPLMKDGEDSKRLSFSEFPYSKKMVFGRAIQSLNEKLIDSSRNSKPLEYYDITKDPGELNNLIAIESIRVSDLMTIMNDTSRSASSSRTAHPVERVKHSEDTIKKLKSLGYIQ